MTDESYCEVADVKDVLSTIEPEDTASDVKLERCIRSADKYIDALATARGLTIPSPTPQLVTDASAHFAAYYFRTRGPKPSDSDKSIFDVGQGFIDTYFASIMDLSLPFVIGNVES